MRGAVLAALAAVTLTVGACRGGEGDRCQLHQDCESDLRCLPDPGDPAVRVCRDPRVDAAPADGDRHVLRLEGLTKRFGERVAVDGLTLEARAGEVLGLLGPNGAGKTTTVHMAVGVLAPDGGVVDVAGRGAPDRAEARRAIGIAPQALALYEELTGEENLAFFGGLYGLAGRRLAERAGEVLGRVELTDRRRDRVRTYSGGMKRRLNLAVALLHGPEVVFLDEPTAGVDPQSRNAILELVGALRGEGRAVVYTTHYMEEAERVCDRIAIVDHGRLLALGTVDELVAAHGGRPTLVAELPDGPVRVETDDPLAELNRLAAGAAVRRFHVERPTLEQVFLALTGRELRD